MQPVDVFMVHNDLTRKELEKSRRWKLWKQRQESEFVFPESDSYLLSLRAISLEECETIYSTDHENLHKRED